MLYFNTHKKVLYNSGDKEIPGLYIIKFICALMVITIHFPVIFKPYIMPLNRIAVPIFYMITGYFMLNSTGKVETIRLIKSLKKVLKISVVAISVYIFYYELLYLCFPETRSMHITSLKYWINCVIFGSVPAVHLWYLIALSQAIIIILLALRYNFYKWLYLLIPVGLSLNLLLGKYNFLLNGIFVNHHLVLSRNVFTIALPCILIGTLIRQYEHLIPRMRILKLTVLLCIVFMYLESYILSTSRIMQGDIILFTIPCAIVVFLLFLHFQPTSNAMNRISRWSKDYSLDVYIWHVMVGEIFIIYLLDSLGIRNLTSIFVAIATMIFAVLLNKTKVNRLYI